MQFVPSISALASSYDGFIVDLWGVVHDGAHPYAGVAECLRELHRQKKKILFLSNAPRRASAAEVVLNRIGVAADLYDRIVTSGETAYQCLADPQSPFFRPRGKHFFIGLEKDQNILAGLPYEEVKEPEVAEFLLLAHSYFDNQPMEELMPLLKRSRKANLPAVCINPDLEVVRINGDRIYCAAVIAEEYRKLGGEVVYFGKPHPAVYEACFKALAGIPKARMLAVGDNLATDIKGAKDAGIASALVTGGLLHEAVGERGSKNYENKCGEIIAGAGIMPDFVIPSLSW